MTIHLDNISPDIKEYAQANHKTELTSFKVNVPDPVKDPSKIANFVGAISHPQSYVRWICFNFDTVKKTPYLYKAYKDLKENFSVETSGYDDSKGLDFIWFCFSKKMKKGLEWGNLFYPVGMCAIYMNRENKIHVPLITLVWLHPYLRNNSITKSLMFHLLSNRMHMLDPPVTTAMIKCMNSAGKLLSRDVIKRLYMERKDYKEDLYNVDFKDCEPQEFLAIENIIDIAPKEKQTQETVDYLIKMFRSKEYLDELKRMSDSGELEIDKDNYILMLNKMQNQRNLDIKVSEFKKQKK